MKAVKAILILISFIISIFGVNSKINILCGNVNAFDYQGKIFNLQVEIVLGIISIIILCSLIVPNRNLIIPSESSTSHQVSLACCFPKADSRLIFFQYNN